MVIEKNHYNGSIDKLYPYTINGGWDGKIPCSLSYLVDLYKDLEQMPEVQEAILAENKKE